MVSSELGAGSSLDGEISAWMDRGKDREQV